MGTKLFQKYLQESPRAPNYIEIDHDVNDNITLEMIEKDPSPSLFLKIQKWILQILFLESFPKFLSNKLYPQYLAKLKEMVIIIYLKINRKIQKKSLTI